LRRLAQAVPLVLLNRRSGEIPAVLMNVADGMREAVSHLAQLGHRRIAYLGGPRHAWSNRERVRGLRAAVRSNDLQLVQLGPFEPKFEGGIEGARLATAADVTAMIAYNDLVALGALRELAGRGVRVPDEMSVVGFDDLLFASMSAPPLTTVATPMEAAGRATVDLLLAAIEDETRFDGRCAELTTQLVVRATTAPPRPV
jgi:LacI family transcriptional regulator